MEQNDLYTQLIEEKFKNLNCRIDGFCEGQKKIEDKLDKFIDKMDTKMTKLENFRWFIVGISVAVSTIFNKFVK